MFETLPFELTEGILLRLSPPDIAVCQRVCRHFLNIIKCSNILQYAMECYLARALDNPFVRDVALYERLEALRKWRKAYETCTWTGHIEGDIVQPTSDLVIHAFGAAYVEMMGSTITVTQPASTFRGRKERHWTLQDVGFEPKAYSYGHSERILALAEGIDDDEYCIHLISPETGHAHSSAAAPSISISVDPIEFAPELYSSSCDIDVYGSLLHVSISRTFKRGYIDVFVYDWKSGDVLLYTYTESYHDATSSFAFLDDAHIILPVFDELCPGGRFASDGFAIVQIVPGNPEPRSWGEVVKDKSSLFLELPEKSSKDADRDALSVWSSPIPPPPQATAHSDDIFIRDPSDSTVGMAFRLTEPTPAGPSKLVTNFFNVVVPSAAIIAFLSAPTTNCVPTTELRSLPWRDWGCFAQLLQVGFTWQMDPLTYPLYGSRYLRWDDLDSEPSAVSAWDFQIPGVLRRIREGVPKQLSDTGESPSQPSSLLPYRHVPCGIAVSDRDDVVFGDDFVVVLRGGVAGWRTYKKELYWI